MRVGEPKRRSRREPEEWERAIIGIAWALVGAAAIWLLVMVGLVIAL